MFESGKEKVGMELLNVKLGFFASSRPDDRAPFVVNLAHVVLGFFSGESEYTAKNDDDVVHEIDGIVVNDNVPWWRMLYG